MFVIGEISSSSNALKFGNNIPMDVQGIYQSEFGDGLIVSLQSRHAGKLLLHTLVK